MLFMTSIRSPWPRPGETWDNPTGYRDFEAGHTAASYGLTVENIDRGGLRPFLIEGEAAARILAGTSQPDDINGMEKQELSAALLTEFDFNPPDRWGKKKLASKLRELRAAKKEA